MLRGQAGGEGPRIPFVGGAELRAVLDPPRLVEALRARFRDGGESPLRHHHDLGHASASLLLMPSWIRGGAAGVKVVTVFPGNPEEGRASVQGVYLLLDARGTPRAVLDGAVLTGLRTGAASALAASYLARRDTRTLLMVGTGSLAPYLVEAHAALLPIREVLLWGRRRERAQALASGLSRPGLEVAAAASLEEAARRADLICCATTSREPLVQGDWLRPGTHLDLVGGYTPQMREADDRALTRSTIFVDTRVGALAEAGDVLSPLGRGLIREEDIRDLFDLARGVVPGRTAPAEITLFKSVGCALEDLAAAELALGLLAV